MRKILLGSLLSAIVSSMLISCDSHGDFSQMELTFKKNTDISNVAYLALCDATTATKSSNAGNKTLSEIGIDGNITSFMFDFELEGISQEQKEEVLRRLEEEYSFCTTEYIELFGEWIYLKSTRLIPSEAVQNAMTEEYDDIYLAIDQHVRPALDYKDWIMRISDGAVREMESYPLNRYAIKGADGAVYWFAPHDFYSGISNYALMRLSSAGGEIVMEPIYEAPNNIYSDVVILCDSQGNVFLNNPVSEGCKGVIVKNDGSQVVLYGPEGYDGILKIIDDRWYCLVQIVDGYYPSVENVSYKLYRLDISGQDPIWTKVAQYEVEVDGLINVFTAGDFHKKDATKICVGLDYCYNSEWYTGIIDLDHTTGQGNMITAEELDFRIYTRAYDKPGHYQYDIYGVKNYYLDSDFNLTSSDLLTGKMQTFNLQKPSDVIIRNMHTDFRYYSQKNAYQISASVKEDASNAVIFVYCDTREVDVVYCGALETEILTRIN